MIDVKGLKKNYGGLQVLKGVDLTINKGDCVVLVGPSGCGKSTFLRCLNRLEEPDGGHVIFNGKEVTDHDIDHVRQKMGMVFQHFNLFPHLTVKKNITLAPVRLGLMKQPEADKKAMELLERIGLNTLTSPSLTGEWEYKLKQMEQASLGRDSFMNGIKELTGEIVKRVQDFREAQQQVELPEMDLECPCCHAHGLKNTLDAVSCRSCKFSIRKVISGRDMTDEELKTLIVDGKTGILQGFTSRFGKPFDAGLELNDKCRATLYFPAKEEDDSAPAADAVKAATVTVPGMGAFTFLPPAGGHLCEAFLTR